MTLPPPAVPLGPTSGIDEVTALITDAAGADTAAIEAREAVAPALRRAQVARTQLATQDPSEVLRQALLRHAGGTS